MSLNSLPEDTDVTLGTGPGKSTDMARIVIGRWTIWSHGGNVLGTLQCWGPGSMIVKVFIRCVEIVMVQPTLTYPWDNLQYDRCTLFIRKPRGLCLLGGDLSFDLSNLFRVSASFLLWFELGAV